MRRGHPLLLAGSVLAWAGPAWAGEVVTYRYDALGRLTRVERTGTVNSGINTNYRYDCADNRAGVATGVGIPPPPPPPACPAPPPPGP